MFLRQGLALGLWGIVLAVPLAYLAALGTGILLLAVNRAILWFIQALL